MHSRWIAGLIVSTMVPPASVAAQATTRPSLQASPGQFAVAAQLSATAGETVSLREVPTSRLCR
jgi:hypothetical protein